MSVSRWWLIRVGQVDFFTCHTGTGNTPLLLASAQTTPKDGTALSTRGGDWACTFAHLRHKINDIFNFIFFIVIYLNVPKCPNVRPSVHPCLPAHGRTFWTPVLFGKMTRHVSDCNVTVGFISSKRTSVQMSKMSFRTRRPGPIPF